MSTAFDCLVCGGINEHKPGCRFHATKKEKNMLRTQSHSVIKLLDADAVRNNSVVLGISASSLAVAIEAEGCSVCTAVDETPLGEGNRPVILVELWEGELRCIVWSDIKQADPTHIIPLTDALISNRKED